MRKGSHAGLRLTRPWWFLRTRGQADVGLNRPGLRKVRAGARWFVLRVCVGSGAVRQGCLHPPKKRVSLTRRPTGLPTTLHIGGW